MYSKEIAQELEKVLTNFKGEPDLPLPFPFPRHAMDYTEGVRFFINECGGFDVVMFLMETLNVLDPSLKDSYEIIITNLEGKACVIDFINSRTGNHSTDALFESSTLRVRGAELVTDVNVLKLKSELNQQRTISNGKD